MGSPWALACAAVLLLVPPSSASADERTFEQREVTFDLDKKGREGPDPFMMQKEVDWTELLEPKELPVEQVIVPPPEQLDVLGERGGSRPALKPRRRFGPRSFGGPPALDYPIQFPLARPTSDNLEAICLHGERRPRYPESYLPATGFGQQKRRAAAVNNAESWFSTCCDKDQTWTLEVKLCCATEAWELSVNSFCEEDSSVKDRLYHCCRLTDSDRLNCFNGDAPNPNYGPTEEIPLPPLPSAAGFNFDPTTCQRTVMTPYSVRGARQKKEKQSSASKKVRLTFPPGRPTADNIESLCHNQKNRPVYSIKCLTEPGYEWLANQAKAINRIEKGFKQCCKKKQNVLNCADQKWNEELEKFCSRGIADFFCCSEDADSQRKCFQTTSMDPHYNATEELSLGNICDTHKIIKKKFPVGFPLKSFVDECCPLPEERQTLCSEQKVEELSRTICSSRGASPPAVRRCCRGSLQDTPQCLSKILMDAITKASSVLRKKKTCPFS